MTPTQQTTTLADYQAYASGSFLAFMAPYNAGSYVYGKNYTESIIVPNGNITSGTVMSWDWGTVPCSDGVYNFSAIDYGYYDNTVVPTPITASTINGITTITELHNLSISGDLLGFDVIDDMFLTTSPDNDNTQAFEVEVFLHTPTYSAEYVRGSTQIGTFQGSGTTWTVAISPGAVPDILLMPSNEADVTSGTIDLKAMLQYLVSQNVISGGLYFNGFALGTETQEGSGSMTINSLAVAYATGGTTTPTPTPVPTTDTLTLRMAEDAYQENAQFVVLVDGTQVGGTYTASARESAGDSNVFTLTGSWGAGPQDVQIQFLNDAYGGSSATDRNLYVNSMTYDGITNVGPAAFWTSGTQDFTVGGSVSTVDAPPDVLTVQLSKASQSDNAQFVLLIDGNPVSAALGISDLRSSGQWQAFSFAGTLGAGNHTIGVEFADGSGHGAGHKVYVDGISLNGAQIGSGVTTLSPNGVASFVVAASQ
jgi:hypothetical protein